MKKISFLLLSIFLTINCFGQTYWRIENDRGEELLLTININTGNLTFETYTRKDALKEMAGSIMYMVAKTAGKIRYPELMHGEGKISFDADTTFYNGNIEYPDKQFSLNAKTWKNRFFGLLTDNKNKTTILTGEKIGSDKPLKDYTSIINNSFSLVEKYFWDAKQLKSPEWLSYKKEINDKKTKIADDYELAMTTMWLGKKLTQIPREIKKINKKESENTQNRSISLRMVGEKKAYLSLNNIPEEKESIDQLFKEIQTKNFDPLILDARSGRRNFTLKAALLIAGHLSGQPSDWGVFLTRKWSDTENKVPQPLSYETLLKNPLTSSGLSNKNLNETGYYLKITPALPLYKGKIYLLTDKGTSNVAEAFAIYLGNEKKATLVGQKTAGNPTLNEVVEIDKQYRITIPIAQFYDKNGKNYQGIGVIPDLPTEMDALNYVIKLN